jgi:hypothetical protein
MGSREDAVKTCVGAVRRLRLFKQTNGYQIKNIDTEDSHNYPSLEAVFVAHSDMKYYALTGKLKMGDTTINIRYRYITDNAFEYIRQDYTFALGSSTPKELYREPLMLARSHQAFDQA